MNIEVIKKIVPDSSQSLKRYFPTKSHTEVQTYTK